ncbi:Malic enzyme, partial [Aphis craccivora]
ISLQRIRHLRVIPFAAFCHIGRVVGQNFTIACGHIGRYSSSSVVMEPEWRSGYAAVDKLTQSSVRFIVKVEKMCGSRNHQFPVLSSDCTIRFPTRFHFTG